MPIIRERLGFLYVAAAESMASTIQVCTSMIICPPMIVNARGFWCKQLTGLIKFDPLRIRCNLRRRGEFRCIFKIDENRI